MPRLIWTRAALNDVERLRNFLKSKDPDAARRAVARIHSGVRRLQDYPMIGRASVAGGSENREWPIAFGASGYVVLYRFVENAIFLVAVRHMREGLLSAAPEPPQGS